MIAIDLSKQEALDADQKKKKIRKLNFSGNEAREVNANAIMFLSTEEAKETVLDLWQRISGVCKFVFALIKFQ